MPIQECPEDYMITTYELMHDDPEPEDMSLAHLADIIKMLDRTNIDGEDHVKLSEVLEVLGFPLPF